MRRDHACRAASACRWTSPRAVPLTSAMRVALVIVASTSIARARPLTPDEFEACKARHHDAVAAAMAIADVQERGRQLVAAPRCVRHDDGTLEIEEPPLAAEVDRAPFAPQLDVALRVAGAGIDYERYATGYETTLPFIELHTAYAFASFGAVTAHVFVMVSNAFDLSLDGRFNRDVV